MPPKVSVIVPTMRLGGLDVTFNGLAAQTFRDFELVLVDKWAKERAAEVGQFWHECFKDVELVHVPPRPVKEAFAVCSYMNTGLVHAGGELTVFMADYTWVPPNWLDWYWRLHEKHPGDLACGHWWIIKPPKVFYEGGKLLSTFLVSGERNNMLSCFRELYSGLFEVTIPDVRWVDPAPAAPEAWYTCNAAIPTQLAVDLNGFDEALDGALVFMDVDLAKRARMVGHGCWWLDNPVFEFDHRLIEQDRHITKEHPIEDYLQDRWRRIEEGIASVKAPNSWSIAEARMKK